MASRRSAGAARWVLGMAVLALVPQALVAGAYLGALLLALWVTGAWRRVLVEHFPGIPLPPSG